MRHRSTPVSTCQRYALAVNRVNSATAPGSGPAWPDTACRLRHAAAWGYCLGSLWTTVDPQAREALASMVPGNPNSTDRPSWPVSGFPTAVTIFERGNCGHKGPKQAVTGVVLDVKSGQPSNIAQPVDKGVEPRDPGLRDGTAKEWERDGAWSRTRTQVANQASQLEVLWPGIVDSLPPNQRVWLTSSKPLMLAESTAVVAVPNEFTRNQLEGRLRTRIEDTLSERLGKPVRLAVSVDPTLEREVPDQPPPGSHAAGNPVHTSGPGATPGTGAFAGQASNGPSNPETAPADHRPRRQGIHPHGQVARTTCRQERQCLAHHRHPGQPAEPALLLRDLRDRVLQPVRPRRRRRGRRGAGQGLQPAPGVRRLRTRQDPPAARHRPLRAQPVDRREDPLRLLRGVHQRRDQRDQGREHRRPAAPLPRRRRAPGRRHPVPRGQAADAGGVLPHLQHAAQRQQADRDQLRPAARSGSPSSRTGCATGSSGACSPTYSLPTSRPASRSCARRPRPTGSPRPPTCWSSSPRASRPTSASSRAR